MLRSWWLAALMLAFGLLVAVTQDEPWLAGVEFVIFVALAVLLSPLVFPKSLTAAQAQERSARDGRPIVYWRPGCRFCLRLRRRLGPRAGRVYWVNIWNDPDGAAAVRAITGGDETVPTVVAGGEAVVNPEPGWLVQRLTA
ncbi:glutaredoxin domain-containing protein [Micromonospora soli]|uniref:glutaredoxin domain-containing protein n=1 Tax=Micromonospora sp. NBRC 110009 TaxID=3061627 RepID=UPI002673C082|nr:glutaredoxin domain-containing protein [Micromonospora sp. NBRC 110009]WKT98076.1 glutaredoxin domain-containing protein [Micromonospora sp. NBRC 110009]